jgi:hypothetical protein
MGSLTIHFHLPYGIKRLLFVIEVESVYRAVRTEPLFVIRLVSGFKVQKLSTCDHSIRRGCNYGNGFGNVIGKVMGGLCQCSGSTDNMQEQKEITETE